MMQLDLWKIKKVEVLREDCRSLHTEPLHQGAELPRQAVVQKGLSTFRNSFTFRILANCNLREILKYRMVYALYGLGTEEITILEGSKR